jgi:hypothetical protein
MAGGARKGAGRKPVLPELKKEAKGIRLSAWVWEWLDSQEQSRGKLIEDALIKVHNIKH